MKNCSRVVLLVMLMLTMGCAGTSPYMHKATMVEQPTPDKALVYFMRPSGLGFAIHFQIWDSYHLIGLSQAKSFFAYECEPGKHLFIGRAENKRVVDADLEAGKSYYVITQVKMGAWRARMAFIPVTRSSIFWNKVEQYKKTLNFLEPTEQSLAEWQSKRKSDIKMEISKIISYVHTPEGEKYVVALRKEDGR